MGLMTFDKSVQFSSEGKTKLVHGEKEGKAEKPETSAKVEDHAKEETARPETQIEFRSAAEFVAYLRKQPTKQHVCKRVKQVLGLVMTPEDGTKDELLKIARRGYVDFFGE